MNNDWVYNEFDGDSTPFDGDSTPVVAQTPQDTTISVVASPTQHTSSSVVGDPSTPILRCVSHLSTGSRLNASSRHNQVDPHAPPKRQISVAPYDSPQAASGNTYRVGGYPPHPVSTQTTVPLLHSSPPPVHTSGSRHGATYHTSGSGHEAKHDYNVWGKTKSSVWSEPPNPQKYQPASVSVFDSSPHVTPMYQSLSGSDAWPRTEPYVASNNDWVYDDMESQTKPPHAPQKPSSKSRLATYLKGAVHPVRDPPRLMGTSCDGEVSWNDVGGGEPHSVHDYSGCLDGDVKTSCGEMNKSFTSTQTISTKMSDCGNEYLSVADVFRYVTLGGRLSDSDLIDLGRTVCDTVKGCNYSLNRYIQITKKVGGPWSGTLSNSRIKILHYTMEEYPKMAEACLSWYSHNVRKVIY